MTRFRLILSFVCIVLIVNFSLIVHFELEQKRELERANQLGMDNQLWQFFQLSSEYARLREALQYGDRHQLDEINLRFDIYFSRINGFANNQVKLPSSVSKEALDMALLKPLVDYIHFGVEILKHDPINKTNWVLLNQRTKEQQEAVNNLIQAARSHDSRSIDDYRKNIMYWGELRILLATTQIIILLLFAALGVYALWKTETSRKKLAEFAVTLQEARLQADVANAAKSRFLAHISHEIRTPLTSILGYTDRLLRKNTLDKEGRREIGYIENSGTHLLSLLNNVLDLSKSEQNKISLIIETISLKQLRLELEAMFNMMAKEKGLRFNVFFDDGLEIDLSLDAGKLRQILINLLGNSLKFTQRGAISLTLYGEYGVDCYLLHAAVVDTGCGIKAEDQSLIFSPFEQSKLGQLAGGTGLGLSLSRDYARLMKGDIIFSSQEGEGSEFIVTIETQVVTASVGTSLIGQSQQPSLMGRIILVVEDETINREMICGILQDFGATTLQACNGFEAIFQVKQHPAIDSIIMDYQMPQMDGMAAAGILRQQQWKKPIYLVSASPLEELQQEAGFVAFSGHLRKPFKIDELLLLLGKWQDNNYKQAGGLLDYQTAIHSLGFKFERYLALCQRGLNRVAELELLYKSALKQQELNEAVRYAHSAKGIALQIGAIILGQHWSALEVEPDYAVIAVLNQVREDTQKELDKLQYMPIV